MEWIPVKKENAKIKIVFELYILHEYLLVEMAVLKKNGSTKSVKQISEVSWGVGLLAEDALNLSGLVSDMNHVIRNAESK